MNTKQPHIETLQMTIGVAMAEEDSPQNIEIPLEIKLPNGRTMYPACVLGGLPFHGQQQIAERIAAAWNAFTGIATTEIHAHAPGAGGVEPLRKRECLHQICETAAPASDGEYPKLPERAAFEDWIKKDGGDLRMFGSGQNTHYCNSAVNNAWGGWKASAARVATTASAPVVLPAPDVFAKVSHKGAAKWDVEFTWPVGKFEEDGDHKLYTEQQVRAMLATATGLPAQAARTWSCPVRTVADLVNNLLTMDQTLPIYGAQYIEHPAGRRRAIAVPLTVSIERVKDSRWIGEGEAINTAIIWTRAEQPAAPQALDAEQQAFEDWLALTCPSGDVDSVQRQWEESSDYADLHEPSQAQDARDEVTALLRKYRKLCQEIGRGDSHHLGRIDAAIAAQQGGEYPVDTGNPEANRIIGRLASSDPDFEDCVDAVALIHKLVAEHKWPAGFATWKDAAISERMRRVDAAIDTARASIKKG